MKPYSLRLRLVLGAAALCALALGGAGVAIVLIFADTVRRDQVVDLGSSLDRLTVALAQTDADPAMALPDARYATPGGGLYFQVEALTDQEKVLRSRSLWDTELVLPDPGTEGELLSEATGPEGQTLSLLVRDLDITDEAGDRRLLRAAVAEDKALRGLSIQAFAFQIGLALAAVVVMLSVAGWLMVHLGLRPLKTLRTSIQQVAEGKVERLGEEVPVEFVPIAYEVNALLEVQERMIQLSRERADDLAHGLKTPLSVMRATAERLRAAGDEANASGLDLLSYEMANRIDYQLRLSQLRIRAPNRELTSSIDQALIRSVAVIRKTGRGADLYWNLTAEKVRADIDAHDLMELVGVLLENAAKWARAVVQVTCREEDGRATFAVLDDGPGLSDDHVRQLGVRGRRLDETKSGTGIGLAVASEIVQLNNGTMELSRGTTGGLNVAVSLPKAS